ncbi:hypothetical protein [Streptomyces bobili]|uniref:hypothetical protein n=1 Tax=Streptomyces bobili TaxID=67280 RepID=UPI00371F6B2A
MDTKHLTVDGYLDTVPTPGDAPYKARFQLIVSPTDDAVDDVTWSCTTSEPGIVHALLTKIQPGDLLHVSGLLTQSDNPAEPARLTVDTLEVLATAPARALQEMVLDRYGDYVVVFGTDSDAVPRVHRPRAVGRHGGESRRRRHSDRDPRARERR